MPDIGTFWFAMTIATGALLVVQLTAIARPKSAQRNRGTGPASPGVIAGAASILVVFALALIGSTRERKDGLGADSGLFGDGDGDSGGDGCGGD